MLTANIFQTYRKSQPIQVKCIPLVQTTMIFMFPGRGS